MAQANDRLDPEQEPERAPGEPILGQEPPRASAEAVTDRYVARRVADHRAAAIEAQRERDEAQRGTAAPAGRLHAWIPILLGLVVSCLLLLVVYVGTRGQPPTPLGPPPVAAPE